MQEVVCTVQVWMGHWGSSLVGHWGTTYVGHYPGEDTGALPTWDSTLVKTLGQYPGGQGHTLMPGLETTVYHTLVHCGVLW